MRKPLLTETYNAEEYNYLYTDNDNMNYYSAKICDDNYVLVDDYDCEVNDIWSERPIYVLDENRLLCIREKKYGVVDYEGWEIIPFVFGEFKVRDEKCEEKKIDVCISNRWGVINLSGKDVCKIKYKEPVPVNQSFAIVEDADTNRKGVIRFDGVEIIPTIFSKIEEVYLQNSNKTLTLYFLVAQGINNDIDPNCYVNGVWGCYNWKGEEVIPVKFHTIHCIKDFFIAGEDEYIGKDYYNDEDYYIGVYDLYDNNGNMIIGGFNHIQIKNNYFILQYGIEVKQYWETRYWGDIPYDEDLNYKIIYDNSISVIIDKDLKSLVSIHLITDSEEDIKYEYDVLMNIIPERKGMLVGEYTNLKQGASYSAKDKIIQRISVKSARFEGDNIIMYYPFKEIIINEDFCEYKLCGLIFCNERQIIPPKYRNVKGINNNFVFIQNSKGLVGIRSLNEELIKPQFDLITNLHKNIAVAFKIICDNESDDELNEDYDNNNYKLKCEYTILKFVNNIIEKEECGIIEDNELYELLYSSDLSFNFIFNIYNNDDITNKEEYWKNIPRNDKDERFWFPLYSDFKFLSKDYTSDTNKPNNDWDDNWDYYNDNLDMDQQSPEFWNF